MKFKTKLSNLVLPNDVSFADGVSNTTTTYTSATATFVAGDVGKVIYGTDIPSGTTIASRTNGTTIVLSAAATGSHSGLTFIIANRDRTTADFTLTTMDAGALMLRTINYVKTPFSAQFDSTFADGVSNTDTSYVSASAAFVAGDVGKTITGTNIPANTTIASRTNGTTIVLSQATTGTGTTLSFTIKSREHLSAATVQLQTASTNYGTAFTALSSGTDIDITDTLDSMTATSVVKLHVVLTGANLTQLSAGEINSYLNFTDLDPS